MPVNVKLLKKVRKLIAEEPRRLRMKVWGNRWSKKALRFRNDLPPCGTTACLAGNIMIASAKNKREVSGLFYRSGNMREWYQRRKRTEHISDVAARLIGISEYECPFGKVNWDSLDVLAWIDRQIDAAQSK